MVLRRVIEKKQSTRMASRNSAKRETGSTIYVGHLPHDLTERALKNFASQFGHVQNITISRSASTGRSRGYGFIEFENLEAAVQAVHELNGSIILKKCVVAHIVSDIHKSTYSNRDQHRRIKLDEQRRAYGYTPTDNKVMRGTKAEAQAALIKMIGIEAQYNERNLACGIDYQFTGFSAQFTA